MRAYSIDLRERIVKAVKAGKPKSEVARLFEVNVATVKRYLVRDEQGALAPKSSPGRPRRIPPAKQPDLIRQLEASPDATLEEHCIAWKESHAVSLSVATMFRSIERSGYTLKKRRYQPPSKMPTLGPSGEPGSRASIPSVWSSLTSRVRTSRCLDGVLARSEEHGRQARCRETTASRPRLSPRSRSKGWARR